MRLIEAIDKFSSWRSFKVKTLTVKGYHFDLRNFCLYMRNPGLEEVQLDDVLNYLKDLRELGWDENSFMRKCMAFRKFFDFYKRQGMSVIDPELIPIPYKQFKIPRVATVTDYQNLISVVPANTSDPRHIRNMAIIKMLWDTGARNGEIASLNVADLDLENMKAVIHTEKSRGRRPIREIFWTRGTNEAIKSWLKKRVHLLSIMKHMDKDAVFISLSTSLAGQRINTKGIGEMLRKYSNKAGLEYTVNAHSFRHHMGHNIIKQGGSSADVSNILGHSSLESSYIYTMMSNKELQDRYKKFNP